MDTSIEFNTTLQKVKSGSPVNGRDIALIVSNDINSLFAFMLKNDYKQVYRLLHESDSNLVIGENANFLPNEKRVVGEINLLITKKDIPVLNQIISGFVIDTKAENFTANKEVLISLEDVKMIKQTGKGLQFNRQLK